MAWEVNLKTYAGNQFKELKIVLGGRELKYTLKRTGRRSIGISIDKNGAITVAGPYRVSETTIRELLEKKASWILDKLSAIEAQAAGSDGPRAFIDGEGYLYMGRVYKLKLIEDRLLKRPVVRLGENSLEVYHKVPEKPEELRAVLREWYVAQFAKKLEGRLPAYSQQIGVSPGRVTIREQKTRWGSCSSSGNLNFNWKLVMAPVEVMDYVIVHELCHMKELNHSSNFWALVGKVCPDYKNHRKWLKENGNKLTLD